ncbi:MAG: class I SAM-dependent methyltransferase [Bacteroidota bacterium]|nr:class I SAM-dependent methyltransferase [Bacteroidota bacterium]
MAKTKPFDNYSNDYEKWFDDNHALFASELEAIKKVIPENKQGIEIGVGSGLFASKIGISEGVEPSQPMRKKAIERNINVLDAVAENLPYPDKSKDFALMVTVICFVDNVTEAFKEAYRVLNDEGCLIVAFIDKESPVGKVYEKNKNESDFYREATFFSTSRVIDLLKQQNFEIEKIYQTIYGDVSKITSAQKPLKGYGQGSFVVIKANKKRSQNET